MHTSINASKELRATKVDTVVSKGCLFFVEINNWHAGRALLEKCSGIFSECARYSIPDTQNEAPYCSILDISMYFTTIRWDPA